MANPISVLHLAQVNMASAESVSFTIDLDRHDAPEGYFSLQAVMDPTTPGVGTVNVKYACSNNGTDFTTPSGASNIYTTFGVTSGPLADGKDIKSFSPLPCRYLRLTITETGAGSFKAKFILALF